MDSLEITLDLSDKRLIVYDFETDGFWDRTGRARPIEVAVLYIDIDGAVGTYSSLIKRRDNTPLPDKITEITGITSEQLLKEGKPIEDVFSELNKIFNDKPKLVVGHNILNFDNNFLNFRFNKLGYTEVTNNMCFDTAGQFKARQLGWMKFPNVTYDVYHSTALSRRVKGLKFNLGVCCDYHGIKRDVSEQHRAMYDVYLTLQLFKKQLIEDSIILEEDNNIHIPQWEELKSLL
jgi:DNA polymerase III epsilon subunit-like protein